MFKVIELKKIEDVLAVASDQPYDPRNKRNRGYYLYRGLPDDSFELKTSLQRTCGDLGTLLEPKILANFSKYTATEADVDTDTVHSALYCGV